MNGLRNIVSTSKAGMAQGHADQRLAKRPVLPVSAPARPAWLSTLGMAVAYLGLVAILSMAPFWQQGDLPQQGQPTVATDFGGSR